MAQRAAPRVDQGTGVVVMRLDPDDVTHDLVLVREQVSSLVLQGARTLVVDASGVQRLSSATITALLWAQRRCRARGGSVVVRRPSAETLQMLVSTGLYGVLDVELDSELDPLVTDGPDGRGTQGRDRQDHEAGGGHA